MADLPPGVPALLGDFASVFSTPDTMMTADTVTNYGLGAPPLWGLFLNGVPVVVADTVTRMAYKQDWAIADYPVERGGFMSYDKVNTPFLVDLQFASGGSIAKRQALLASVEAIGDTLAKFDAVTPEKIYTSVNVARYAYQRAAAQGLGLMTVDIGLLEIREEPTGEFKAPKSPSGYAADQAGNVQSVTPGEAVSGQLSEVN